MSIVYPLTPPSSPTAKMFQAAANNAVGVASSPFTWSTQAQQWPAERWEWQIELPPMLETAASQWIAFLVSLRGSFGTCELKDPSYTGLKGVGTGTPLVNGAQSAQSTSLVTDGWTAGVTGILKARDYIQLTNTSKRLHMVLKDVNSDSSGNATIDIFPCLRSAVTNNQAIVLANPTGTFRLASNKRDWSVDAALRHGISFGVVEAF